MTDYIYADNAATTSLAPEVLEAMKPWLTDCYGNASGLYRAGREARRAIEKSRSTIAELLGCEPGEIYFTSGGTESDNWALAGTLKRTAPEGKTHLITDGIEHHAVLHTAEALEKEGFSVSYASADRKGRIGPESVRALIRPETALVSVMFANNEIGTIQPVKEIGEICREYGVAFHTDAVQAAGILPIDVDALNIDLLSMSAHKFYGPKGIGLLYCRRGKAPLNLMHGGKQEKTRRPGTENTALIVGMAEAYRIACEERETKAQQLQEMKDILICGLSRIRGSKINGDIVGSLPGTVNFSFEGTDGQSLVMELDSLGVAASSGSACTSGNTEPSHVLRAIGLPHGLAQGALRISLGRYNTEEEARELVARIEKAVETVKR